MDVRLTSQAWEDLYSIWRYIATESERSADACIERIIERTNQLSPFPRSGPQRSDIADDTRALRFQRWLILYRVAATEVRVVRIVDGARDLIDLEVIDD